MYNPPLTAACRREREASAAGCATAFRGERFLGTWLSREDYPIAFHSCCLDASFSVGRAKAVARGVLSAGHHGRTVSPDPPAVFNAGAARAVRRSVQGWTRAIRKLLQDLEGSMILKPEGRLWRMPRVWAAIAVSLLLALIPANGQIVSPAPRRDEPVKAPVDAAGIGGGAQGRTGAGRETPFPMMEETVFFARVRSSGKLLVQAFYVDWQKEVERLKQVSTPDKVVIDLCYGEQYQAIETFLGVSDEFVISAFIDSCGEGPRKEDKVWPGFDHHLINRLRKIRALAPGKHLYATIPVTKIVKSTFPSNTPEHSTTLGEAQWMVYALVGADWDGILWFDFDRSSQWAFDLLRIEEALGRNADDIASASPVDWVTGSRTEPLSALCSERRLFVVLLNPAYYAIDEQGVSTFPIAETPPLEGQIVIKPPQNRSIESGSTLLGKSLELVRDGGSVKASYAFTGGGEMLVFDVVPGGKGEDERPAAATTGGAVGGAIRGGAGT